MVKFQFSSKAILKDLSIDQVTRYPISNYGFWGHADNKGQQMKTFLLLPEVSQSFLYNSNMLISNLQPVYSNWLYFSRYFIYKFSQNLTYFQPCQKERRKCKNDPNMFCYICGDSMMKEQRRNITSFIKNGLKGIFRNENRRSRQGLGSSYLLLKLY